MKSKFFIYILPLILGVVATILMLNAPQPQKGVPKKPVASAPSASVPPVIPEVAENKEEATKEEAAEDEKTEEAEQTEETEAGWLRTVNVGAEIEGESLFILPSVRYTEKEASP